MNIEKPINTIRPSSQIFTATKSAAFLRTRYWLSLLVVGLSLIIVIVPRLQAATDTTIIRIEVRLSVLTEAELRQLSTFCESRIATADQCEKIDNLFRYSTVTQISEESSDEEVRAYLDQWLNSAEMRSIEPCDFAVQRLNDGAISFIMVNRE